MSENRTCMSFWFPKIAAAGIRVPLTKMLIMPKEAQRDLYSIFDGAQPKGVAEPFFAELAAAASEIGYPCFLRTGLTSGKHEWDRCCYLTDRAQIKRHVVALIEHSEVVDFIGLDWSVWAVREFLPTTPLAVCPHYGNMPVCREFRFFVEDNRVACFHPYWPMESLEQGGIEDAERVYRDLCAVGDSAPLIEIAQAAGAAVGGAWSVDLLETKRGWYVTDMAEADKSFHWGACPFPRRGA